MTFSYSSTFSEVAFCLNQDVQDLRMYRMVFPYSSIFSEVALIQISQNINIKYNPVNPLILVILIQTVKF